MNTRKSKYKHYGAYHHEDFKKPDSLYHLHVMGIIGLVASVSKPGDSLLDVGCGEGVLVAELDKMGWNTNGIDRDERAVGWARKLGNNVTCLAAEDLPSDRYDVITILDVLEHVDDMAMVIERLKARTGTLITAVPQEHDKWAVRQHCEAEVLELLKPWDVIHRSTQHSRHVAVARRNGVD